ncbi:MAG: response regulator [Gemmatimonadota bacterium]|nr:response regulator [Gemmatimonadota bacterium]
MSGRASAAATILLVEDNDTIREAFTILLEDSGYRIVQAANGAAALQSAEIDPPHLILMDLGLPDVDGLELVRTLARRGGSAPIVALTGRALETDQAACLAAGCAGYVTKPVDTEELLRLISTFLAG